MNTVYFVCTTNYQVFICYIISKFMYKDYRKVLIVTNILINVKYLGRRLNDVKIWDEVIYIDEKNIKNEEINDRFKIINGDVFHIFTFGCGMTTYLIFKYIFNEEVRIILTEEGTSSYFPEIILEKVVKNLKFDLNSSDIINRIDELWMINKNFYFGKDIKYVRNININELIKSNFSGVLEDLNYIFKYKSENINKKLLFFDTNFAQAGDLSLIVEKVFLSNLFSVLKDFKLKLHPNDLIYKYNDFDVDILKNIDIPWELIYLNNMYYNNHEDLEFFMTYSSTAVFNTKFLNPSKKLKLIFLYKLASSIRGIETYISDDGMLERVISKYKDTYPEDQIYIPESFEELEVILDALGVYKNDNLKQNTKYLFDDLICEKDIEEITEKFHLNKNMKDQLYYLNLKKRENKKYIIWGAGVSGDVTLQIMKTLLPNWVFLGFVDKYKEGEFKQNKIYKPDEYHNLNTDMIFIATTPGKLEVEKFLISMGLKLGEDYLYGYNIL